MSTTDATPQQVDNWGTKDYDGPQPWDHKALGVEDQAKALEPGQKNDAAPTVSHSFPILTSGSSHPAVHELGRKLADLGYPNSVSRGENPFGAVDGTILSAIDAFRSQYNVEEDPSGFGGHTPAGRQNAAAHIGPWTSEGILRAHEKHQHEQE